MSSDDDERRARIAIARPVALATCRAERRGLLDARVEELAQDTLEIVWAKLKDGGEEIANFEAWVRGIALNVCRNARRKKMDLLTEDGVIEATDLNADVLRRLRREQRHEVLVHAIERGLSGIEQDVLYHRYIHEMSRARIAELLGLPDADAVRVVLIRARRHLKDAIINRLKELGMSQSVLRSEA
jgi:RNA polymerase sigma factor (sigma-70 family)